MVIDKVLPFYTQEEKDTLNEIQTRVDELLNRMQQLRADSSVRFETQDEAKWREFRAKRDAVWTQIEELLRNSETITGLAEQRYIDAKGGSYDAILEDVKDIFAHIGKDDVGPYMKVMMDRRAQGDSLAKKPQFEICRFYLLTKVKVQLNALAFWMQPHDEIVELAERRAEDFYKKPKGKQISPAELPASDNKFFNVPTSPGTNLIMEVLGAGKAVRDLGERKKKVNHSSKYEIKEKGRMIQVKQTAKNQEITLEISDIEKLAGSNKSVKKLFVHNLIKANEQAIHDGELARDYISFPLQELIDIGIYSTPQSARKGFRDCMSALTSFKIEGTIAQTKKRVSTIDSLRVLFTGFDISNGQCVVYLNPRVSWTFLSQYFTILPPYYFKLPARSSELLFYIFYLARQNTREIKDRGYFTISFRAIQERLQLPSEKGNREPTKTIRQPIEEALTAIEDEHKLFYDNTELQLTPHYDTDTSISDFLDRGYLEVALSGELSTVFIQRAEETQRRITQYEKRRRQIAEKAQAIKAANAAAADGQK